MQNRRMSQADESMMALALAQARLALPLSRPNPAVGCVLVGPDGAVLGAGHTQQVGGPHAEIMALRAAQAAGHALRGATAYVTLEPCAHHGRTGPCCDALAAAGVARVVASLEDPNPLVAGQGFTRLRAAGVVVEVGQGAAEARELNLGFFSRIVRGTPWVRMKAACSLDGRTALPNGVSQWITSEAARADGHVWRARAGAVLTGIGTVLEDDPLMNVRLAQPSLRQPDLVVIDSRLELSLNAKLWTVPERRVLVYTASADAARQQALEAQGAAVICLPNPAGKVALDDMLRDLGRREVNDLHVEAGFKLNGSLLREGLVDELLVYLAPRLMGEGAGIAAIGPFEQLTDTQALQWQSVERVGDDLRLLARLPGRDAF